MAIDFVNVAFNSREAADCPIGLAAYVRRELPIHEPQGRRRSAGFRTSAHSAAAIKARTDPDPLHANIRRAALNATTSMSRLHGLGPNRPAPQRNAALTRHVIASLPKKLSASEIRQLAIELLKSISRERTFIGVFRVETGRGRSWPWPSTTSM